VTKAENLYVLGEQPGFTPQIGRLVSMMRYVRHTTLGDVAGLGTKELDYLHDSDSNSIGALLAHVAAVECWYQADTFENRALGEEELRECGAALDLGEPARREIRGHELAFYVDRLERVRARTLSELARRDDAWLEAQTSFGQGQPANNHFKWFHVFEDELITAAKSGGFANGRRRWDWDGDWVSPDSSPSFRAPAALVGLPALLEACELFLQKVAGGGLNLRPPVQTSGKAVDRDCGGQANHVWRRVSAVNCLPQSYWVYDHLESFRIVCHRSLLSSRHRPVA